MVMGSFESIAFLISFNVLFSSFIANTVLKEAMRISEQLRMQTEIDGIFDRNETIQNLLRNGPNPHPNPNPKRPQQNQPPSRGGGEVNPDDLVDLFPVVIQSVL